MNQTNNETAQAVDSTVPVTEQTSVTNNEMSEQSNTTEVALVSYDDVLTKIALRHPQEQVEQALKTAIEQEQAAHVAAYQAWELEVVEVEAARQAALVHNANLDADSDELIEVPELPTQPQLDLSLRRTCYQTEYVAVDLETTTETQPARTEYDDDAYIKRIYPATQAHSEEHIAKVLRERFKQTRTSQLANQTVLVDELEFDADELSQQRMARAILVMDEQQTIPWVLADNEVAGVSKAQLFKACKLAAERQTALWIGE